MAEMLVLPVGIEPTTSPLPRGCSTTELRQRLASVFGRRKHIHDASDIGKASDSVRERPD